MYVMLTSAEEAILTFFGSLLGAIGSFFLYIFENVSLFGLSALDILFLMIVIAIVALFIKVVF